MRCSVLHSVDMKVPNVQCGGYGGLNVACRCWMAMTICGSHSGMQWKNEEDVDVEVYYADVLWKNCYVSLG